MKRYRRINDNDKIPLKEKTFFELNLEHLGKRKFKLMDENIEVLESAVETNKRKGSVGELMEKQND